MYYELGATEEGFCSTSNPQGSCKPLAGVCKPMTTEALSQFKDLQNQLNRVAQVKGYSKIWVDGRIGKDTLALYNKVQALGLVFLSRYGTCDELSSATLRGVTIPLARRAADDLGAPATVAGRALARPSSADPSGGMPKDPPALAITDQIFNMISSPMGLLIAVGLGYGAYRLVKGKKKGKREAVVLTSPPESI
jgi:hypothetical protein